MAMPQVGHGLVLAISPPELGGGEVMAMSQADTAMTEVWYGLVLAFILPACHPHQPTRPNSIVCLRQSTGLERGLAVATILLWDPTCCYRQPPTLREQVWSHPGEWFGPTLGSSYKSGSRVSEVQQRLLSCLVATAGSSTPSSGSAKTRKHTNGDCTEHAVRRTARFQIQQATDESMLPPPIISPKIN